jgi:hypothetical protein
MGTTSGAWRNCTCCSPAAGGHTEVLYVTELIGLLFIYAGFYFNTAPATAAAPFAMAT